MTANDRIENLLEQHRKDRLKAKPERCGWRVTGIVIAGLAGLLLLTIVLCAFIYAQTRVSVNRQECMVLAMIGGPVQVQPLPLPEPQVTI